MRPAEAARGADPTRGILRSGLPLEVGRACLIEFKAAGGRELKLFR